MNVVTVAFVGAGYMAESHIQAFSNIPNVSLVGIFSRSQSKAEALALKYGIKSAYSSIQALCDQARPDLVVVAVPIIETKKVCFELFNFSCITLLEKPVGLNVEEASEICNYAKAKSHLGFVALNRRHYSSTKTLLELLDKDEAPRLIQIFDQEDLNGARSDGHPEVVIENWMYANSIHLIDLFRIFGRGEIDSVDNFYKWNANSPFFSGSRIKYSSGDIGIYQSVWNAPGPWSIAITNHKCRFEMRPIEALSLQAPNERSPVAVKLDNVNDLMYKPGLRVQALEAIKAVQGRRHTLPTISDALLTMKLTQMLYEF